MLKTDMMDQIVSAFPSARAPSATIRFERTELDAILAVYGRMVGAGEWRDYAIDFMSDAAVFSAFRRTSEAPLYRIEKRPALARKQGAWVIVAMGGQIVKRGHEVRQVLDFFERKLMKIVT
jgi:hypothetical protein